MKGETNMSDVKQLALEVFEGREEAEKRIPKVIEENLDNYVKKIIEIFKIYTFININYKFTH